MYVSQSKSIHVGSPAAKIALGYVPVIALRISSVIDLGGINTIDPLDVDASMSRCERERVFSICAPWCGDGEDSFELQMLVSITKVLGNVSGKVGHVLRESSCRCHCQA